MTLKRRLLMLLALTLAVALAGFNGVAQGQAVKNPDTLIIQSFGDPESLDPAFEYDTTSSATIVWNIYETLIFFQGGRTELYEPILATEVTNVANGVLLQHPEQKTYKRRPALE